LCKKSNIERRLQLEPSCDVKLSQVMTAMPRYFFTVLYGDESKLKNEGLDLRDNDEAWVEATVACAELLHDLDGRLKPGEHWSMQVKDESGRDLYLLEFKTKSL